MYKKRVLVTGGAGFIGSHLCRKLLAEGCDVICVDNLFTGRKENIQELLANPYFEFVRWDVSNPFMYEVDQIYNLACPASPVHYQYDPVETVKTNVMGAINVLEIAKKTGARVLQASTSEVYGDPLIDVQVEEYWGNVNPIGLRSCYDEGKRCAETLFFDYHREYNVDIRVARIFNTYGPYMHPNDGRVVSNFIVQALQGRKITIYGDGSQTRSFCYVSDLVNGLFSLMNANDLPLTPVNLGNPAPMTMLQLANKVQEEVGIEIECEFHPLPQDDPKKREPNITKANTLLGWSPKVDLEQGIRSTVKYFKETLNGK
jgi:UDP-glucuronate decarboxylase